MEWFSGRSSIAGVQVPHWMVVLGAIIVILIINSFIDLRACQQEEVKPCA
jgi:hypothetical protein